MNARDSQIPFGVKEVNVCKRMIFLAVLFSTVSFYVRLDNGTKSSVVRLH